MTDIKPKLLVIDDHPFFGMDLKYKLSKYNIDVYTSENGKNGIIKALEIIPDVIFVDYIMPEMDGVEVCKKLKQLPNLNSSVIMLYTSEAYPAVIKSSLEAGAKDFIIKTAPFEKVLEKIQSALKGKGTLKPEENNKSSN